MYAFYVYVLYICTLSLHWLDSFLIISKITHFYKYTVYVHIMCMSVYFIFDMYVYICVCVQTSYTWTIYIAICNLQGTYLYAVSIIHI